MKEYKVIKLKYNILTRKLNQVIEETLNEYARRGWQYEDLKMGNYGYLLIISRTIR